MNWPETIVQCHELLRQADPIYTIATPNEKRAELASKVSNMLDNEKEKKHAYFLFTSGWTIFVSSQTKKRENQVEEIKFSLKSAEYNLREAHRLCELDESSRDLQYDICFLLARVIFSRIFVLDFPPTETDAEIEKNFQEICKNLDFVLKKTSQEIKKLPQNDSTSCDEHDEEEAKQILLHHSMVLYVFGAVLSKWSLFRSERWDALCQQSKDKLNASLQTGSEYNFDVHKLARYELGILHLNWINRMRRFIEIYKRDSKEEKESQTLEKLLHECITLWETICRENPEDPNVYFYWAHALNEHALYLCPTANILPPEQQLSYSWESLIKSSSSNFKIIDDFFQKFTKDSSIVETIKTPSSMTIIGDQTIFSSLVKTVTKEMLDKREELLETAIGKLRNAILLKDMVKYNLFLVQLFLDLGSQRTVEVVSSGRDCESAYKYALEILIKVKDQDCTAEELDIAENLTGLIYLFWARAMTGITADLLFHKAIYIFNKQYESSPFKTAINGLIPLAHKLRSQNVIRMGYIIKKGGLIKNWKKRFFILTIDTLDYFTREDLKKRKRVVPAESFVSIEENTDKTITFPFCLQLKCSQRTFYLKMETKEEMDIWKKHFQYVILAKNTKKDVDYLPSDEEILKLFTTKKERAWSMILQAFENGTTKESHQKPENVSESV